MKLLWKKQTNKAYLSAEILLYPPIPISEIRVSKVFPSAKRDIRGHSCARFTWETHNSENMWRQHKYNYFCLFYCNGRFRFGIYVFMSSYFIVKQNTF